MVSKCCMECGQLAKSTAFCNGRCCFQLCSYDCFNAHATYCDFDAIAYCAECKCVVHIECGCLCNGTGCSTVYCSIRCKKSHFRRVHRHVCDRKKVSSTSRLLGTLCSFCDNEFGAVHEVVSCGEKCLTYYCSQECAYEHRLMCNK